MNEPVVLYEDNHLLVLNKPAGMASAGVTDKPSVYRWAGAYLKFRYKKPGNVYVGIVSRLDTVTSGVMVVARTSKAASRLSEQLRQGSMSKTYVAVLSGIPNPPHGHLVDTIVKDDQAHRMRVLSNSLQGDDRRLAGGQVARLDYETLAHWQFGAEMLTGVKVRLLTGRKHQIRVQFADRNMAIWGDRKYGHPGSLGSSLSGPAIALHAWKLALQHPTRKEWLQFTAPIPKGWSKFVPKAISLEPVD